MLLRLLFIAAVSTAALGQESQSLEDLINTVFAQPDPSLNPVPDNEPVVPVQVPDANGVVTCPGGECVPYYLCSESGVITDGVGLIDVRFDESTPCVDYLESCCSKDGIVVDKITPPPPPTPTVNLCGYRNVQGVGFRTTGNTESEFGEFPWMLAVLREERINNEVINMYECGGSLIHPKVAMTGAHCIFGKQANQLRVRAGEWDTQTKNEIYPHQDRGVSQIVIHPQYNKGALQNDVALLFLQSPFEINQSTSPNIGTVCLPPQNHNFDYNQCIASGWGKDVFGKDGKYQVILKKVDLPIVPRDQCQKKLRTTRLGKYFKLHESFICAGGIAGKDTCKGDGGSPLTCPIPGAPANRFYQSGIVAWGIGCGENQVPGVYVNVALFRNWIDQQMLAKNLDTKSYTYSN